MLAQEDQVPAFREATAAGRRLHRRWVERTFAPWLRGRPASRGRTLPPLVAITDVYLWKLLRRDQRLSRPATERVLLELVHLVTGVS